MMDWKPHCPKTLFRKKAEREHEVHNRLKIPYFSRTLCDWWSTDLAGYIDDDGYFSIRNDVRREGGEKSKV